VTSSASAAASSGEVADTEERSILGGTYLHTARLVPE
jgi:hypothetical protein